MISIEVYLCVKQSLLFVTAKLKNDRLVQIKEGYKTSTKTIKKRRLSHTAIFNIYNMSTALAHV